MEGLVTDRGLEEARESLCSNRQRQGNKDPRGRQFPGWGLGSSAQLFQSWQMWRPHSQERWCSLSSSVKKEVTT